MILRVSSRMQSTTRRYLVQSVAGLGQLRTSISHTQLELRPSGPYALAAASAKIALPHGDASLSWVRSGGRQYDKVSEGDEASLSCGPRGGLITGVEFASFGTPAIATSDDNHANGANGISATASAIGARAVPPLRASAHCHAPRSAEVVASRCVGKPRCNMLAHRSLFGFTSAEAAGCHADGSGRDDTLAALAEPLRLWVAVTCERPDAIDANASVPVGSTATLRLPLRAMERPVLRDGRRIVYANGAAMPSGVHNGEARDDEASGTAALRVTRVVDEQLGEVLSVQLGSGSYDLALEEGL